MSDNQQQASEEQVTRRKQPSRTGISKSEMDTLLTYLSGGELMPHQERAVRRILNTKTTFEDVILLTRQLNYGQEDLNRQFMERFWILEEVLFQKAGATDEDMEQAQQAYKDHVNRAVEAAKAGFDEESEPNSEEK